MTEQPKSRNGGRISDLKYRNPVTLPPLHKFIIILFSYFFIYIQGDLCDDCGTKIHKYCAAMNFQSL